MMINLFNESSELMHYTCGLVKHLLAGKNKFMDSK